MYTKLPTLTTFVHGVMWACIMQSRDYMYIQELVLSVGVYRDQVCLYCYQYPNVQMIRVDYLWSIVTMRQL